jgi:hypothetical protein
MVGFHEPPAKRESYFFWEKYGFCFRVDIMKMGTHNNFTIAAVFASRRKQTFVFNICS